MFISLNYSCYSSGFKSPGSRIKKYLFGGLFTGFLLTYFWTAPLEAYQSHETLEQLKVKAAFVLNLARFVEWPDDSTQMKHQDVNLCFYQYNFLDQAVETIRNKKIHGKSINIKIESDLKISERCEVVLIPAAVLTIFLQHNQFENLQKRITITDLSTNVNYENSLENKIIFRLQREQFRLRFEVNKQAADKLGVVIGSELLKLGILVTDQERAKTPENNIVDDKAIER